MKDDDAVMTCIGAIAYLLILAVLSSIWNGYIFSVLWNWFVVPLGVVSITIAWAIGLSLMFGLIKSMNTSDDKTSSDKSDQTWISLLVEGTFRAFLPGLITLGLGYIVHLFM